MKKSVLDTDLFYFIFKDFLGDVIIQRTKISKQLSCTTSTKLLPLMGWTGKGQMTQDSQRTNGKKARSGTVG